MTVAGYVNQDYCFYLSLGVFSVMVVVMKLIVLFLICEELKRKEQQKCDDVKSNHCQ